MMLLCAQNKIHEKTWKDMVKLFLFYDANKKIQKKKIWIKYMVGKKRKKR